MTQPVNELFTNTEEIFNWTYPGATLYYKDCDLTASVIEQFEKDSIIRNGYSDPFVEVQSSNQDSNTNQEKNPDQQKVKLWIRLFGKK